MGRKNLHLSTDKLLYIRGGERQCQGCYWLLIRSCISLFRWHENHRSWMTLKSLHALCYAKLCGVVAKCYVVGGRQWYCWIWWWRDPYRLTILTMSVIVYLPRFGRNFECKLTSCLQPSSTCAKLPYRIIALIVAFDIQYQGHQSVYGTAVTLGNLCPQAEVGRWPWDMRYGRPTLATADWVF